MIGRLNHVAIAVPDLKIATALYRDILGAQVSEPMDLPEHGVVTVFVDLANTKIELLGVLGDHSPIASFLEKNTKGGMHHICYEVDNISKACEQMKKEGMKILGTGKPKIGAHGKPVIFMSPKDFCGTLIELEEV